MAGHYFGPWPEGHDESARRILVTTPPVDSIGGVSMLRALDQGDGTVRTIREDGTLSRPYDRSPYHLRRTTPHPYLVLDVDDPKLDDEAALRSCLDAMQPKVKRLGVWWPSEVATTDRCYLVMHTDANRHYDVTLMPAVRCEGGVRIVRRDGGLSDGLIQANDTIATCDTGGRRYQPVLAADDDRLDDVDALLDLVDAANVERVAAH